MSGAGENGGVAVDACVFDAYGTLFDVHSAVSGHVDRLGEDGAPLSATWRAKQLEYTWLRSLMDRYVDFSQVTADALDFALDRHGVDDPGLRQALLDAYLHLEAFADVVPTLTALREAGIPCVVLSNGTPDMLAAVVEANELGGLLDAVLSVHPLGVYKPDPRVYRLAVDHLGVPVERIAFQSSNAWDAAGAATFGFTVGWVNRYRHPPERLPGRPTWEVPDLSALLPLLLAGSDAQAAQR